MHRDLKLENIVMNSVFDSKIIDIGLVHASEMSATSTSLTNGIGTLAYMSPEMASEEEYSNKTDVYSFGIVLHYIFTGGLPAYSMKDKMLGKQIPLPSASSSVSEFCIDLISKCTSSKPDSRPSFEEILEDIRAHSYGLASEIDKSLIRRRDSELSFYESIKT